MIFALFQHVNATLGGGSPTQFVKGNIFLAYSLWGKLLRCTPKSQKGKEESVVLCHVIKSDNLNFTQCLRA